MTDGRYVLLATEFRRREGGRRRRYRQGDVITGLSDGDVRRLVKCGAVAATSDTPPDGPPPPPDHPPPSPPAKVATKAVLVDWLATHGGYDRGELADQSKDDLWALIDATD